jgi:glycosyltransferase involved in cell wall biosynthesis
MKVLVSRPLTLKKDCTFPGHYRVFADEQRLSHDYGLKYPRAVSEYVLRSRLAADLLGERGRVDAIVTGRYGEVFAALQGLLPLRRTPHLLLDVEWPHRRRPGLRKWLSGVWHRAVARGAWKIQVFCEVEADNYAAYYGIDRDRFIWLPYCVDPDTNVAVVEEDFIFSGGTQHRDYATLFAAVDGMPMEVRIGAPRESVAGLKLPDNVTCLGRLPGPEFLTQMARARLVVLALEDGLLRYPGVITYVTALRLGKCVIVNDPHGARSYITNGETGVLVPSNDPQALAETIRTLWFDRDRRQAVASRAREHAARYFSLERYRSDVDALLCRLESQE